MNLLVCEFATKRENRKRVTAAVAGGLNLDSVVQLAWAASHDRMRREAAAAALVGDLKGTAGTSTWLTGIVAVWRNRASRRGDWVGDGAVTEEAMRFSLTRERDGPQLQITRPQFGDRSWAAGRRNCSS